MSRVVLVGCSHKKLQTRARARDLYRGALFQKAKCFAEGSSDSWYVLSAKHGLISPDDVIDPYDTCLETMNPVERSTWASNVLKSLGRRVRAGDEVTILAGSTYRLGVSEGLKAMGAKVHEPLAFRGIGRQLRLLDDLTKKSDKEIATQKLYTLLDQLAYARGGLVPASSILTRDDIPESGVYFFFEPSEVRSNDPEKLRVVRVGSHAVSRGSKATLTDRLKAHLGTTNGGNHRTSIFRLHLGECYLTREGRKDDVPSWGTPLQPRARRPSKEDSIEKWVSSYIRTMSVLWVAVPGQPSKSGPRAQVEKNCIALLSGVPIPIDPPSPYWLGRWSSRPAIRKSGLWNVQHTEDLFHPSALTALQDLVNATSPRGSS